MVIYFHHYLLTKKNIILILIATIIVVFFEFGCSGRKCSGVVSYDKKTDMSRGVEVVDSLREFNIFIEDGFDNDEVEIVLNDSVIYDRSVSTDPRLGVAKNLNFPDKNFFNGKTLKVLTGGQCASSKIDIKYNVIRIDFRGHTLKVIHANYFVLYE